MTSLPKFEDAFNVKQLSETVDFIDLYSWDLQGPWNGRTDFSNPIDSPRVDTLTLVG